MIDVGQAGCQQGEYFLFAPAQRQCRGLPAEIGKRVAESSGPPLAVQPLRGCGEAGCVVSLAEQPLQAGDVPGDCPPSHWYALDQVPRRIREELVQDRPG
jgi:hypothetical protein